MKKKTKRRKKSTFTIEDLKEASSGTARASPRPPGWPRVPRAAGLGAGEQLKGRALRTEAHPSPMAQPTREQRVIFAPQNMQIQGRPEGQWVETSEDAEAVAVDHRLAASTNGRAAPARAWPLPALGAGLASAEPWVGVGAPP